MIKYITSCLIALLLLNCSETKKNNSEVSKTPMAVLFETDMGNDIDDALALDMLYKYLDAGEINLLGISINKDNAYAAQFIDIINTWYGYPNIPIAQVREGIEDGVPTNFGQAVCEYQKKNGETFERSIKNYSDLPESTLLYRKVLSSQPDNSVTIISVGYSTNLARLLETPADDYSPLTGSELVKKKVKLLSVMGGNFDGTNPHEYNIEKDVKSAQKLFTDWPTKLVLSPFEVGIAVNFPGNVIENNLLYAEEHPLAIAYKAYLPMPYDRPTWDLTSTLYAIEGADNYFGLSSGGVVEVDGEGATSFTPTDKGKHFYLTINDMQKKAINNRFIEMISQKPLHLAE